MGDEVFEEPEIAAAVFGVFGAKVLDNLVGVGEMGGGFEARDEEGAGEG